jgi:zinc protease
MKYALKIAGVALLSLLFSCANVIAQESGKSSAPKNSGAVQVTSVEGITEYLLPNGLKVLLFPDPSKPTITVNVTYEVGSRMEGYGETGMAHLLEHMMFRGSTHHPNTKDELTAHGGQSNGSTYYDRTNYYEIFPARDDNLDWAISLESDRMVNSFIADSALKKEFSVVRNEFEMDENNPSGVLYERILATAYLWHNYGKSPIGSKEDIERVPASRLKVFYQKYYQPDNAVLLVAGKIDEQKTLNLITKYFGAVPKPTRVLEPTYTVEPVQDGERSAELRRVGDVQSVACAYHIVAGSDPDYAAFDVLKETLTAEPEGRLYKNLVKTGMATTEWGTAMALRDPGMIYFNADVLKDRSLDSVKEAMFATIGDVASHPITEQEVTNAKNRLLKYFEESYRNSEYIGILMSEFIAQGDWRLAFLYRDGIKKVTAADVNRVADKYLIASNRTWGEFIPTTNPLRAEVPPPPDIDKLVKGYKGQAALAQAEAFEATPANIEKRTQRGKIPGGARYAFLTKTTRGNTVNASITLHIGSQETLKNKKAVAVLTGGMLKRGTKTKSLAQINELLDKLSSSVYCNGYRQDVNIFITSTRENLPQVLDLVDEMLHQPAFSEDEFKTFQNEYISNLEQQRSDPQSIAFREYARICNPRPKDDINYTMSADEEVAAFKSATVQDVQSFYKDYYNGIHADIAIVGDFDAGIAKEKLTKTFAEWKSPVAYVHIPDPFDEITPQNKEIKTPDKKNAVFVAGMNLKLKDINPDYPALMIGDFMFGGGFGTSRLSLRLRENEGLSYGAGSFLQAGVEDESGAFTAYAIYNPDNKVKLENAWNEEFAKMLKDGYTNAELEKAKTAIMQSRETERASDEQQAYKLNNYLFHDRTFAWDAAIDEKLHKLTTSEVNAAMKKYLASNKVTYVKAGDFK